MLDFVNDAALTGNQSAIEIIPKPLKLKYLEVPIVNVNFAILQYH